MALSFLIGSLKRNSQILQAARVAFLILSELARVELLTASFFLFVEPFGRPRPLLGTSLTEDTFSPVIDPLPLAPPLPLFSGLAGPTEEGSSMIDENMSTDSLATSGNSSIWSPETKLL